MMLTEMKKFTPEAAYRGGLFADRLISHMEERGWYLRVGAKWPEWSNGDHRISFDLLQTAAWATDGDVQGAYKLVDIMAERSYEY